MEHLYSSQSVLELLCVPSFDLAGLMNSFNLAAALVYTNALRCRQIAGAGSAPHAVPPLGHLPVRQ